MKTTVFAVLSARLNDQSADKENSRSASGNTRYFNTYMQVVTSSLKKFASSEVIAETESEITRFAQLSGMTTSWHAKELVTKTLRCRDMYKTYALNKIVIEGLDATIRHSMREFWRGKNEANLHKLAFHATSA